MSLVLKDMASCTTSKTYRTNIKKSGVLKILKKHLQQHIACSKVFQSLLSSPFLDFVIGKYLQHPENLCAYEAYQWRQFFCFTSASPKNLPVTHRQTYRYPLPRTTHLKTAVKEIRKNHTPFKTLYCLTLTYIIKKGIHKVSYIQHLVFAKPVADLQLCRPASFWQLPLIPLILGSAVGMALFCASSNNDNNFRILSGRSATGIPNDICL